MTFTEADKKKVMAVVRIFETGKATGDYAACAVLDDGAGISYGISQFTHRSGSLAVVVEKYLATGCSVGRNVLAENLPLLNKRTAAAIGRASADTRLKKALKAAAITAEMRGVQDEAVEQIYLRPAIERCEAMGFVMPLSLAVIYDSMTHGSWEKIRDAVGGATTGDERAWIISYVRRRDVWLKSVRRLAATRYRTQFFLRQIGISNWELKLPVMVHGVRLTCEMIFYAAKGVCRQETSAPVQDPTVSPTHGTPGSLQNVEPSKTEVRLPNASDAEGSGGTKSETCLEWIETAVNAAAEEYDRVESAVEKVITRTDSAKSLWTMIAGTAWQTVWGLIGFFIGLPKEVWLVVAVIAGGLCAVYLYRQIVLGKIREMNSR